MISNRKKLGAYYTPQDVTDVLSNWAIRNAQDKILEPSFGGCNFLTSSIKSLDKLGCKQSLSNIYGFDIDPTAFEILKSKKLSKGNFYLGDFLESSFSNINIRVPVILGNPPYLPIHKLDKEYKTKVYRKFENSDFKIPRRSSLWVYFIVHSLEFLELGGRMAWVVPDSIAFTDYGKTFLSQLSQLFNKVMLTRIEERFFDEVGTYEKTALLLCDGFRKGNCEVSSCSFETLSQALSFVKFPSKTLVDEKKIDSNREEIKTDKLKLGKLGDVFDVKIGIVLGATKLLTFKRDDAINSPYYPDYVYPIITKGKQLSNLTINKKRLLKNNDSQTYLIDAIKLKKKTRKLYKDFFESFPQEVLTNQTFAKRDELFGYDDFRYPDAFVTYFTQKLPRIVINNSSALNCTNSVHRLYIKKEYKQYPAIAQFLSLQLFADIFSNKVLERARVYGNNIRKYEPSNIADIPVFIPMEISVEFSERIMEVFCYVCEQIDLDKSDVAQKAVTKFFNELVD